MQPTLMARIGLKYPKPPPEQQQRQQQQRRSSRADREPQNGQAGPADVEFGANGGSSTQYAAHGVSASAQYEAVPRGDSTQSL